MTRAGSGPLWVVTGNEIGARNSPSAAIAGGASVLLTFNLRHFPTASLAPCGVVARQPDGFLCALHAPDGKAVVASVDAARRNLSVAAPGMEAFLLTLERQNSPSFVAGLRGRPDQPR